MKNKVKICLLLASALVALALGVGVGSSNIPLGEVLGVLGHKVLGIPLPEGTRDITVSILWTIRFPRAVMAFLIGASLSVSGTVMQSVLRNPLASSYTLGVSSGASLMAALVIVAGFQLPLLGVYTLPLFGFLGGLGTVFLAMMLSLKFDKTLENHTIILVGMVLSLFVNALLTLITALSSERLSQLIFWQMGSFSGETWQNAGLVVAVLLACLVILQSYTQEMDIMTFGSEQALSAGVELRQVKIVLIALSALMTGVAVAFTGVIGFVDLIAPHIVRRLMGSNHRWVVPGAALFGGIFLVLADLVSRTLMAPQELPVGAVTALIGAPFFAYMYFRRKGGRL